MHVVAVLKTNRLVQPTDMMNYRYNKYRHNTDIKKPQFARQSEVQSIWQTVAIYYILYIIIIYYLYTGCVIIF